MSPGAAEAKVAQEDQQAEALRQRQMMLARRGRSVGEVQGEGAPGMPAERPRGVGRMGGPVTPEERRRAELDATLREAGQKELEAMFLEDAAVAGSLGLGGLGYWVGGPLGGAIGTLGGTAAGTVLGEMADAREREAEERLREAGLYPTTDPRRHQPLGQSKPSYGEAAEESERSKYFRETGKLLPIYFEEIEEHGAIGAARQWRRKEGYELKAIENRLRHHTGVDGGKLPKEEIAAVMATLRLEEGAKVGRGVSRRELHALINTVGPNKAVGQMDGAGIPVSEIEAILQEHGDPAWGYDPISDGMIKGLVTSVRERRRPKIPYGPDPYQRDV